MLYFLEVALGCFFIFMVFKEIMVPMWRGERVFPRFRRRKELEGERAAAVEAVIDSQISDEIRELRAQTKPKFRNYSYQRKGKI